MDELYGKEFEDAVDEHYRFIENGCGYCDAPPLKRCGDCYKNKNLYVRFCGKWFAVVRYTPNVILGICSMIGR